MNGFSKMTFRSNNTGEIKERCWEFDHTSILYLLKPESSFYSKIALSRLDNIFLKNQTEKVEKVEVRLTNVIKELEIKMKLIQNSHAKEIKNFMSRFIEIKYMHKNIDRMC